MAKGGLFGLFGFAGFIDGDRFVRRSNGSQKTLAVFEPFGVNIDEATMLFFCECFDSVGEVEIGHISHGDDMGKSDAVCRCFVDERGEHRA